MYPGFSFHDELEILVQDVGFTAMEALRIATDGVAMFYGETKSFGALEPGQGRQRISCCWTPIHLQTFETRGELPVCRCEAVGSTGPNWISYCDK
jgi:hypothetical protein